MSVGQVVFDQKTSNWTLNLYNVKASFKGSDVLILREQIIKNFFDSFPFLVTSTLV